MAVDALKILQGRGQKVGVISHVAAIIARIGVQVRVEKRGAGRSEIRISNGLASTWWLWPLTVVTPLIGQECHSPALSPCVRIRAAAMVTHGASRSHHVPLWA